MIVALINVAILAVFVLTHIFEILEDYEELASCLVLFAWGLDFVMLVLCMFGFLY